MDEIKLTLTSVAKTITKTSSDFFKTTKLSVSLASEQDALKNLYIEIGKKVHEVYIYGGSIGKFFDEKYDEILMHEAKIAELKASLDAAKGVKTCPACGISTDKNADFCPKCGTSTTGSSPRDSVDASHTKTCPNCGTSFDNNAERCPLCEESLLTAAKILDPELPSGTMLCSACGAVAKKSAEFCSKCGEALGSAFFNEEKPVNTRILTKKCPVCGKDNDPRDKFCFSCGRTF